MNLKSVKEPANIQAFLAGGPQQMRLLMRAFWSGVFLLVTFAAFTSRPAWFESDLGAILIAAAALLPAYLWCSGKVKGVPIFPVYALTFLWTYALPLASNHPRVILYSAEAHLTVALTVAGFLFLGTAVWFKASHYALRTRKTLRTLDGRAGETFFFFVLALNNLFIMASIGGWLNIEAGIFSLIRAVLFGLSSLATFILMYQWGKGELSPSKVVLLIVLLLTALFINVTSLLLVGALSTVLLAGVAFVLGRGRIPWIPLLLLLLCLVSLHYGKKAMRDKYWRNGEPQVAVQPWQYPARMVEWVSYSVEYLLRPERPDEVDPSAPQSFAERASLIHLLLLAQEKSPQDVPYLMGTTYAVIPQLLVPRLLLPDKDASHEGTYLLSIQYGLQTREDTQQTTIGWGLLNEAYGNFGLAGCVMLAILLGWTYGQVARWSFQAPVLSARFLFAVLVLSVAFQTEFSASVYVTALFQSTVPLFLIAVIFMKPRRPEAATAGAEK